MLKLGKMSKQQILKFIIRQDGTVIEEVIGAVSDECVNITSNIDRKLGKVTHVLHKPEYYATKENVSLHNDQNTNITEGSSG